VPLKTPVAITPISNKSGCIDVKEKYSPNITWHSHKNKKNKDNNNIPSAGLSLFRGEPEYEEPGCNTSNAAFLKNTKTPVGQYKKQKIYNKK